MTERAAARPSTLAALLEPWAVRTPEASAVAAPGRQPLDYAGLARQVDEVRAQLEARGIGRHDRVGLVLPQGPEAAVGFLAIAASATCAPLNPAYQAREFEFYLSDLKAAGLVIAADLPSPAREVASRLGVPIIELTPLAEGPAGTFQLTGAAAALPAAVAPPARGLAEPARPDDIALVLHTSGTTARPKIVPLTQVNLCRSAHNMAATLALGPRDGCLDAATLFHIHGLMVMVASWAAGGRVICPPPFEASRFFAWLEECRPTWYSAVPTVHQAILAQAESHREALAAAALRFIRSSSASLPPPVIAGLERAFGCPVIESYGMTEAAHQMASNPLPPAPRKPGSVGRPAGPEIVILGDTGEPLGPGQAGEVAIRGANVMAGYENNPQANAAAFTDGWLRTGDQGYLDADGYLFINGRLKEIINRGGEKIGPREVDEVLLEHPAVAQAVTFPLPHPTLGEDVAAAVVTRPGAALTAAEIRAFAATRLALSKVPNRVVLVPRIPTGATGKFQRRLLAEQLGLLSSPPAGQRAVTAPRDPLEYRLVEIWERLFERRPLGITDDFFDLGGYSLLAARMMEEIGQACGPTLPPATLFDAPTIEALARAVRTQLAQPAASRPRPLVELQRGGDRPPFVFLNGDLYGGGFYCRSFVGHLHPEQPFYTLSSHGLDGDPTPPTIEAMAAAHLQTLRAFQPSGPYMLGGFSHASLVAFEMARQLERSGQQVALLVLVDGPVADPWLRPLRTALDGLGRLSRHDASQRADAFIAWRRRLERLRRVSRGGRGRLARFLLAKAVALITGRAQPPAPAPILAGSEPVLDERRRRIMEAYTRITGCYVPRRYAGSATLLVSAEGAARAGDAALGWRRVIEQLEVVSIPGDHLTCVTKYGHVVGEHLRSCLDAVTPPAPAAVLTRGDRR